MLKPLPKIVSFVAMAALVFIFVTLAGSTMVESEDAVDTGWSLHWIDLHRHFDIHRGAGIYSVERIDAGTLTIFVLISVGLTWILSRLLARVRQKKGSHVA
jgi:hypothetical protein